MMALRTILGRSALSHGSLWGLFLCALLWTRAAQGQDPAIPPEPAPVASPSSELDELRQTVEAQGKRLEELEQSQSEINEFVMTGNSIEEAGMDAEQQRLRLYGFFDLTLNRFFFEDDSAWNLYITEPLSFTMSRVNLFVQANLTDSLTALVELRFTFLPSGDETSWAAGLKAPNGSVMDVPETKYERVDSSSADVFTTKNNRFGWTMIERAHLTWSPREWFQITAGRYLTPYGVWNVDHAPTVVLPVRLPYMQLRDMIMEAQTGLMLFGRVFPYSKLYLDYALTISNGSGRTEANLDFDDEKAFGLKLALTYLGQNLMAEAGGYAAYTTWADRKEKVVIDQTNERMFVEVEDYDVTDELMVSAHLKLQFYGVLLQGEFVLHNTYYEIPPELDIGSPDRAVIIKDLDPNNKYYWASSIGWGAYGLIGYTLPLRPWLGEVLLTPYFLYEKNRTNDTKPHWSITTFIAGLNVQPNRYVTLKAEWALVLPEYDSFGADAQSVSAQLAVSF